MTYEFQQAKIPVPPGAEHHHVNISPALAEMASAGWDVVGNPLPMGAAPKIAGAPPTLFWLVFMRRPKVDAEPKRESKVLVEGG